MKKILVIGSGGREHALCYKFKQSKHVSQVFVAPGNPGMSDVATMVNLDVLDFEGLVDFVKEHSIDLTFVGPELPLTKGIVDYFKKHSLRIFGPDAYCAQLEGSKVFSKHLMEQFHIPTAKFECFYEFEAAIDSLKKQTFPIVIKADGLANGKGVIIAQDYQEAYQTIEDMMKHDKFASSGHKLVIEEFLEGQEFSLLAFVHERTIIPMQLAQDYKKVYDGNLGLNTGGMGSYTPCDYISKEVYQQAVDQIVKPIVYGLASLNHPYTGILYAGCMLTKQGVKTIEYNVRFGDPETEVLLLALESDLFEVIDAVLNKQEYSLQWSKQYYVGVVLASLGYPETLKTGGRIDGLEKVQTPLFHMGSKKVSHQFYNDKGRVLFVTGSGDTLKEASKNAYQEVSKIKCEYLFYRKDIAKDI